MYQNTVENVSCPPVGAFLGPQRQAPYALASYCLRALGVHSETFLYAKKSCLAAAATLPVSRALERAVVNTGRCFFRPQRPSTSCSASNCLRALGVHTETFFSCAKKSCHYGLELQ